MRAPVRSVGAALLAAALCAPAAAEPPAPAPARPDEPAVCLISMLGRRNGRWDVDIPSIAQREAGFRSFRILTVESHDPLNCDVLLELNQKGISSFGPADLKAYAARGGEVLWQSTTETSGDYTWGSCKLAAQLRALLQPGAFVRRKLDALRNGPAPTPELVERLAGQGLLKKKQLDGSERDLMAATIPAAAVEPDAPPASAPVAEASAPAAVTGPAPSPVLSDIDELPKARPSRPHAHAVVIGVERYRENLPNADFAARDAKLTAEYFERSLGVPEENLALLTDDHATRGDFEKYFERWLPNRVEPGDEVFVYYSGHGAPDPKSGDAFLVPYDADPTYIHETGYPLKTLYAQLAKLPAKRVVVALDSCFSGAGGRSVIARGARPLVAVRSSEVPEKITVLSASGADQISNTYQERGHGLFTYFLLKGLKQTGDLDAAFDFAKPEVAKVARREFNEDQNPARRGGR